MSQKDKILLQKLNLHANQTLIAVIDWDLHHNVTFWNKSAERIFGFSSDEVLQKDGFEQIVPNYISKEIDEIWDLLIKNKGGSSSINENVTKSGETIICKWYNTPLLDANNNVISVTSLVMDITKEKRQEKIEKVLFDISKSSNKEKNLHDFIGIIGKKLSSIIDTTNFLIAFADKESNTIFSPFVSDEKDDIESWPYDSKSMSSYIIKNNKSLLVKEKEINNLIDSNIIELVGVMPKVFLGVPLANDNESFGVIALQSYDNKNAYSKNDLELLEFVSNQLSSLIIRKKAQDELKIALEKAKESDRMKSIFLATMSHELRTPLNAIIGFSELMSEGLDSEKNIKFSEIVHKSGLQLFQLVNDIFDVTLLESGGKKITKEKQQLIPILEHVKVQIITEKIKLKKDVVINLEYDDLLKDVEINTDKFKIQQVLTNLLKNALKFTEKGSITFGFTEVVFKNKNYFKFFIKDTGIGISKKNQRKIFDRFTQLEDKYTRKYDGAGIGLSLSKKIVELLEGEIWVDSILGKGSTFYFTIPFDKKNNDKRIHLSENLKEESSLKDKTILIAEDEISNFQYLKVLLKKTQANIIWAKNGQEAIDICKAGKPKIDIILMDLKMPKKSGIKATIEIKKMNPDLPIIAQTAFANMEDKDKALKAGCDDFLTKPLERSKLVKIIKNYL